MVILFLPSKPLIISSSPAFKKSILNTAIFSNIPVTFADNLFQNAFLKQKDQIENKRTKLTKWTSEKILERIDEKLDHVFASSHVEYINREKAFEVGVVVFSILIIYLNGIKMTRKKFFKAADKYEGVENRHYMEIEFALPNKLQTVEQYRQIIDAFIENHLKDHYYAYAIHNKIGTMSNGQRHPNVHIMFSERIIDNVEKIKERTVCNFFKYPARNKKDGSELSFQEKI